MLAALLLRSLRSLQSLRSPRFPSDRPGLALLRSAAATACLVATLPAAAESLRCNGEIASPGDSKISVMRKCGEPMLKDTFCKPVLATVPWSPHPVILPPHIAPCEMVDEWMYDRGPGNLYATVRFQRGVVDEIRYEGRQR